MTETQMPAAEVSGVGSVETNTYELAFHILPTVAEGEVSAAYDAVKAHITNNGGVLTDEEAPERIDLAYDIEKYLEGKYRKFKSAYFGWVRFTAPSSAIAEITEEAEGDLHLLRYLLLKLSKQEEQHAFRYHEAFEKEQVATVDVEEALEKKNEETRNEETSKDIPEEVTTDEDTDTKKTKVVAKDESDEATDEETSV